MDSTQIIIFLIQFISVLARLIFFAILARIIVSWLSMGQRGRPRGQLVQTLHDVTEPILNVARLIPHKFGMFDFAPVIAMIGVDLLAYLLIKILSELIV